MLPPRFAEFPEDRMAKSMVVPGGKMDQKATVMSPGIATSA
jgi:hypothetical protein